MHWSWTAVGGGFTRVYECLLLNVVSAGGDAQLLVGGGTNESIVSIPSELVEDLTKGREIGIA